jgi:hypothetical protein
MVIAVTQNIVQFQSGTNEWEGATYRLATTPVMATEANTLP